MRALLAHGVFEEPEFYRFRLNAAGELLRLSAAFFVVRAGRTVPSFVLLSFR
jgi:hypothetical protein